ncbi:MAG TPA: hypothetical protein VGF79_16400 [Bacteroidia bacterium]
MLSSNKEKPNPTQPTPEPDKAPPVKVANANLILKIGSKGYEVQLLQQKLGISPDGIFGSETQTSLKSATGLISITLAKFESAKSAYQSTLSKEALKAKYEAAFPITKQVIALVEFEAYVSVYRNGNWFSTDLDGKQLPSVTFKKTAQVGAVYSFDYQDPSIVIIALPYQVPHNVYRIPQNQSYNKIRVKASWIK